MSNRKNETDIGARLGKNLATTPYRKSGYILSLPQIYSLCIPICSINIFICACVNVLVSLSAIMLSVEK